MILSNIIKVVLLIGALIFDKDDLMRKNQKVQITAPSSGGGQVARIRRLSF